MKSFKRGKNTSKVEIQALTPHGLWLLVLDKEYFLPFTEFPWFESAPIGDVYAVQLLHERHLYWPKLDIDLAIESFENLEKYPLVSSIEFRAGKKHLRSAA